MLIVLHNLSACVPWLFPIKKVHIYEFQIFFCKSLANWCKIISQEFSKDLLCLVPDKSTKNVSIMSRIKHFHGEGRGFLRNCSDSIQLWRLPGIYNSRAKYKKYSPANGFTDIIVLSDNFPSLVNFLAPKLVKTWHMFHIFFPQHMPELR